MAASFNVEFVGPECGLSSMLDATEDARDHGGLYSDEDGRVTDGGAGGVDGVGRGDDGFLGGTNDRGPDSGIVAGGAAGEGVMYVGL